MSNDVATTAVDGSGAGHPDVGGRHHQRDLVLHLVAQRFRARYRRTRFGWTWAVIQPVLQLLVYTFVFAQLHDFGGDYYYIYIYIGITAMALSQQGTLTATVSPTNRQDLVMLPGFDRRLVPVPAVLAVVIDYLMTLPALFIFLAVGPGIQVTSPLLVVPLFLQMILVLGLGYTLGAINVFVRDVQVVLGTLLTLWFFVTPTFWQEDLIPEQYDWILVVNPMAGLLAAYRAVLMDGELLPLGRMVPALVSSAVFMTIGLLLYRRYGPRFADEL